MTLNQQIIETYGIIACLKSEAMVKLINRIPGSRLLTSSLHMLNRSASLAMSTSILKALSGNSDIKRLSANIIYIFYLSCQEAKYDRVISQKARANSPTPCH